MNQDCQDIGRKNTLDVEDFARRKSVAHRIALRVSTYAPERGRKIEQCGTHLVFGRSAAGLRLAAADFCRIRICPMCQWRRSKRIYSQMQDIMGAIGAEYLPLSLTLTLRNCQAGDLAATLDTVTDGWYAMTHSRKWRGLVRGWYRALEITCNLSAGTYHPHLHCILMVPRSYWHMAASARLEQREIAGAWGHALGVDYTPIVDIRTMYNADVDSGFAGVLEYTKYALKDVDLAQLPISMLHEVDTALAGRRLLGMGGCIKAAHRALHLDDAEDGMLWDDAPADDVDEELFRVEWRCGVYVVVDTVD